MAEPTFRSAAKQQPCCTSKSPRLTAGGFFCKYRIQRGEKIFALLLGLLEWYAPEITYFDPVQEKRVDGIEAIRKIYSRFAGKIKIDRYEMIDPKVQQYGNVAVLTFDLLDDVRQPDGSARVRIPWNCTQVYRRTRGKWRIVSEHWSYIQPEAKIIAIP